MSSHLAQADIQLITGRVRPDAQERVLRELGYIVLGRNPRGEVQVLATHPADPRLKAANESRDTVVLDL